MCDESREANEWCICTIKHNYCRFGVNKRFASTKHAQTKHQWWQFHFSPSVCCVYFLWLLKWEIGNSFQMRIVTELVSVKRRSHRLQCCFFFVDLFFLSCVIVRFLSRGWIIIASLILTPWPLPIITLSKVLVILHFLKEWKRRVNQWMNHSVIRERNFH